MNKKYILYILFFYFFISIVSSYSNIYEFDMNEDIIISTTVYNRTRELCSDCVCNLTVYNPSPNESIINVSVLMNNKGNGIYVYNLQKSLNYNQNIYPISLICNDTSGFMGADDRIGIKIGETMFDYSSIIFALISISALLLFMSFKLNENFKDLKLVCFFGSFPFMIATTFTALEIVKKSPNNSNFIIIYDIIFYSILAIVMLIMFFYARDRLKATLEYGNSIFDKPKKK